MHVDVDADVCGGHGVCCGMCPEVFALHDDGFAIVTVHDVPIEHEAVVRRAAQQCPTHAISVST